MNFDEATYDTIRMYLTQQMSDSEKTAFEQQMLLYPDLSKEVRHWREFRVVAKHTPMLEQLTTWQSWGADIDGTEPVNEFDAFLESDIQQTPKTGWKSYRKWFWGGLIVVVVIGVGANWDKYQQYVDKKQNIEISIQFMRPLQNFVAFAQGSDTTLKTLLNRYDAGNYSESLKLFQNSSALQADKTAQLFAGVSALLNNQAAVAAQLLTPLCSPDYVHSEKALYYLGLAELRLEQPHLARQKWLRLTENAFFKASADSLLYLTK